MDTTLVVNPGSSSKKYAFFRNDREVCSVLFEHVKEGYGKCVSIDGEQHACEDIAPSVYTLGVKTALEVAMSRGVIHEVGDITRIGIRIVAPHAHFTTHRIIDARAVAVLEELASVAPLHIPHILDEIMSLKDACGDCPIVGVSDSAFHATIPEFIRTYSMGSGAGEAGELMRFGYHGLSVQSVTREITALRGSMPSRMIVVHMGSGVSVTAVKDGKSFDTTMGFSPGSGLIMSTRGGDVDAGAFIHSMRANGLSLEEAEHVLYKESGLKGLAGSEDLRIVLGMCARGDRRAQLARDAFFYRISLAISGYVGALGGLDTLVLTATAPERNGDVRARLLGMLSHMGMEIDEAGNECLRERSGKISARTSRIEAYLIPTQEMREIARTVDSMLCS